MSFPHVLRASVGDKHGEAMWVMGMGQAQGPMWARAIVGAINYVVLAPHVVVLALSKVLWTL